MTGPRKPRSGTAPGDKATAAAGAVQGLAVFPVDLPEGGSDFNDMHQAHGVATVRAGVVAAVQAHQQVMEATASASKGNATPVKKKRASGPNDDYGGHWWGCSASLTASPYPMP